jgi:hypothetical protein
MAIQLDWDDSSQQIIRVQVEGRWAWDELEAALRRTITMMDSVLHKVDFIIDVSKSHMLPGGATQAAQNVATPQTHRNEGIKVIVGANTLIRLAYEAYRRINRSLGKNQEFLFARSQEEARATIAAERQSSS